MNQALKRVEFKSAGEEIRPPELMQDEIEILDAYRKAKRLQFADIAVTIQEGVRVKLWITEKKK